MIKIRYKIRFYVLFSLSIVALLVLSFFPLNKQKLHKPTSQMIYDKDSKLLRAFLSSDEKWRMSVRLDEVSDYSKLSVLVTEDRFFYYHPGVNPWSIVRAIYLNIKHREIISGGSTITMQVARMMEHRERTFFSKLIEIFQALKLELLYSKDKILELYFNMAPYGANIEGIGAACYYYFQKSPAEISLAQAALLTAIPNSPCLLSPGDLPEYIEKKKNNILRRLLERRMISRTKYLEAIKEEIVIESTGIPFQAPHFTNLVHRLYPQKIRVYTTLDMSIQEKCQEILRGRLTKWRRMGITNGALVVIDNKNHSICALIGSYDFFDELHSGQVNGVIAPRSPGSTLKPLLYAVGIDKGLITPSAILYDVPVSYAGYAPENYDAKYHGVVTVKEALIHSLNVPAVNLLAKIGVENFIDFLKRSGFSTMNLKDVDYGLSMILGGCEVKLAELTNLFATLANGGIFNPLRYCKDELLHEGERVLSDGASYIITELLSEVVRPDLPIYWEFSLGRPKVAWKTGTSYGHRDAWSVGYTKRFTVGIWVGNFDGSGVPELTGSQVAGPILFDVLNAITTKEKIEWFVKPASVSARKICAKSGMVPHEDCPDLIEEFYLPGVSPVEPCNIHKPLYIDDLTGYRLCRSDLSDRKYRRVVFEIWPSEVATWLERNGYPVDKIPPLLPASQKIMAGKGPIIRSPNPKCEYYIREGVPLEYQKIFLDVSVANSVSKIFWFLNGELIWSGPPGEKTFIYPEKGKHHLVCQDDHGRSTSTKLVIR